MKISNIFPYLFATLLNFYCLPLLIKNTGVAMIILLVLMPLVCLITSLIYGLKNTFCPAYALLVALLFIPSIFIFYNSSAWMYGVAYGLVALIGNAIGAMFRKWVK